LSGYALGIVAADFEWFSVASLGQGGQALGLVFAVWALREGFRRRPANEGRSRSLSFQTQTHFDSDLVTRSGILPRVGCSVVVWAMAFSAGAIRLEALFDAARRDAMVAGSGAVYSAGHGTSSIRFIEARVDSRLTRNWGAEIVLVRTRAVDGKGRIPEQLRLQLERPAPTGERAGGEGETPWVRPSRASSLLWPGVRVRLGLRIKPLRPARNPGTADREGVAARRGLGAQARLVDPEWVVEIQESSVVSRVRRFQKQATKARSAWRIRVANRMQSAEIQAGFARALAIGDRSGLDLGFIQSMRRLGLSHLVAVSGLHITILAGSVGWAATRLLILIGTGRRSPGAPFLLSLLIAGSAASIYGWASGAGVSVQRAVLLFVFFAVVRVGHRTLHPAQALSSVALVLLILDPAILFEMGAQLSFVACAALVAAGVWGGAESLSSEHSVSTVFVDGSGWRERGQRVLVAPLHASLAISLATSPILLREGLSLPVLAPIWNGVAIPWTGLVALPTSIVGVMLCEVLPDGVLGGLLWPANIFESGVRAVAGLDARISSWDLLPILVASGLAGAGVVCIRFGRSGLAAVIWVVIAVLGSPPLLRGDVGIELPRVVFFDVGQGDAAVVQGQSGTMMIDSGGGRDDGSAGLGLVRGLRALGITEVDALVVTHGDLDHRAGASRILEEISVGELWLPAGGREDERLLRLSALAHSRGVDVHWLGHSEAPLRRGDLEVDVLWPPPEGAKGLSWNDGSLVLRITLGSSKILFAADVGKEVEARLLEGPGPLAADVLKVGHHGSRQSTTVDFLAAVSPSVAVISAPCDAARGLPNGAVLERLDSAGIVVGWTGRDGAVFFDPRQRSPRRLRGWASTRRCSGR
jgi:competence protein ComEC